MNTNLAETLNYEVTYADDPILDTALSMYLKEVKKHELLSKEEEYALAKRVEEGDQQARELMATSNLRLVVSVAKKYSKGNDLAELIADGNVGLMKAIDHFEPEKGYRFSTYAIWWIRQSMIRSIQDHARTVRVPVHVTEKLCKLKKAYPNLTNKLNRKPTVEEVADYLGWEADTVFDLLDVEKRTDTLTLDMMVGEEADTPLSDIIADDKSPDPYEVIEKQDMKNVVDKLLDTLTEREAQVLRLRNGIDCEKPMTLEQIAEKFGCTRERIRQIEAKAYQRIRFSASRKELLSDMMY